MKRTEMKRTQWLSGITLCLSLVIAGQLSADGPSRKSLDEKELKGRALSSIQELYQVRPDLSSARVVGAGEFNRFIAKATRPETRKTMAQIRKGFGRGLKDGSVVGLLVPGAYRKDCARFQEVLFVIRREHLGGEVDPKAMPAPDDSPGGHLVADFCRDENDDDLCRNCGGCDGVDPDTGSYTTCICTMSAKVCRECPAC